MRIMHELDSSRSQQDIAHSLGLLRNADTTDLDAVINDIVRGNRDDPFSHPTMADKGDVMLCPIAYRLARRAGYDPAGFLLLEAVGCYVEIKVPQWSADLHIATHDSGRSLELEAPLGDGVTWQGGYPGPRRAIASVLKLACLRHPVPETLQGVLLGRRIDAVVTHAELPRDLVIRKVTRETPPAHLDVRFETNPRHVRLADAAAQWAETTGNTA